MSLCWPTVIKQLQNYLKEFYNFASVQILLNHQEEFKPYENSLTFLSHLSLSAKFPLKSQSPETTTLNYVCSFSEIL